ncbi:MAG: hypothetical protein ACLP19_27210 [Xanthobacteraceae bacterium]
MSALDETVTKKIGKLMRMLSSSFEGEAHNALRKLNGLLEAEGLTFNDIAVVVENHQGEIEERKYSDADAEIIFAKGVEKGRSEEARKKDLPPEFYDADGRPRWNEIALFCQKHTARLRTEWERTFVNDMAGKTLWSEPTEKQAKHLLAIFIKLGGHYDSKAAHVPR